MTMMPRQTQRLLMEDKHDEMLDSYDQRRFGNVIRDKRMSLEEWLADLSADLPAMPLTNGSYPRLAPANRSFTDLMDGVGSSSDDNDDAPEVNKKLPNSVQRVHLFVERCNCRLHHPERLLLWLNTMSMGLTTMDEWDNSFRGMYGPRFTYNPQMNIMYTDREAVDATQAMAEGMEFLLPLNMSRRPNPRGFPMNVREVQETINYIHTHQSGWQAMLHLVCEFHQIVESVIMRYRDLAMHEVLEHFERDERLYDL